MSLNIGNIQATSGMTKEIYEALYNLLSPPMKKMKPEDFEKVKEGWQKLAYSIAKGVVEHIKSNAEVKGVEITIGSQTYTQTNKSKIE